MTTCHRAGIQRVVRPPCVEGIQDGTLCRVTPTVQLRSFAVAGAAMFDAILMYAGTHPDAGRSVSCDGR